MHPCLNPGQDPLMDRARGKREGVSNAIIKGQEGWEQDGKDGQRQIAVGSQGYSRLGEESGSREGTQPEEDERYLFTRLPWQAT